MCASDFPYLLKVLAAAAPLSIQAHPNKAQAEAGFARENRKAIPLSAPHRNYRDDNHKPECLCALTSFWALCGFRAIDEIVQQMRAVIPNEFSDLLIPLQHQPDSIGLKHFFNQLMTLSTPLQNTLIKAVLKQADRASQTSMEALWTKRLNDAYPQDIGVLAPFYLNLIQLSPGQALFLSAGTLHAYLSGTGIELMANSDNVLRGGLTSKHIDLAELMQVLNFDHGPMEVLTPQAISPCHRKFVCSVSEFDLSIIELRAGDIFQSLTERGVEILLCSEGKTQLCNAAHDAALTLSKGEACLVPAAVESYSISGEGVIYKACGPV